MSTELQVPAVLPFEIPRKKNTDMREQRGSMKSFVLSLAALLQAETLQVVPLCMIYSCTYLRQGPEILDDYTAVFAIVLLLCTIHSGNYFLKSHPGVFLKP